MDIKELEEYYFTKKIEGMDFSVIRAELRNRKLSAEDIKSIVCSIDDKLLQNIHSSNSRNETNGTMIIGALLVLGGTMLTFGTYTSWINLGDYYIISYGPILGGLGMMANSKQSRSTRFERQNRNKR